MAQSPMSSAGEIIAYHGWGFDYTCWQSWSEAFVQQGWHFQASDRGYFGEPITPEFSAQSSGPKILLAHSYGLHRCPIAQLQQTHLWVIFGSFLEFHPASRPQRRRSQAILQQMQQQLQLNPKSVLHQFKQNCYAPLPWLSHDHPLEHLDLLQQDLHHLGESQFHLADVPSPSRIVILHGRQDQIVSPVQGEALAQRLNGSYLEIADAGHALPFTHFSVCWSALRPIILELSQWS
jgi:pimeloyl-[acyl-carrier protein] methyl ester esterase